MSEQQPEDDANDSASTDTGTGTDARPGEISDDQLPPDLQPTEDNPLARHPGQTGDDDDKIGADTESGDAENPSASMGYGSDDDNSPSDDAPGESDNAQVKAEEDDGSATLDNGGGGAG
jgi:hypothetical protein